MSIGSRVQEGLADGISDSLVSVHAGNRFVKELLGPGRGLSQNRISSWGGGSKADCKAPRQSSYLSKTDM